MDLDVEGIIRCIRQGDEGGVETILQAFNREYAQCFFYDAEERNRRKQRELEEFRKNKVRDYEDDSDSDCDDSMEDHNIVLRQSLTTVLMRYIQAETQPGGLRVCLRTLRILSRDKKVLTPLLSDSAILTLAKLAGVTTNTAPEDGNNDLDSDLYEDVMATLMEAKAAWLESGQGCDGKEEQEEGEEEGEEGCCAEGGADDAESNVSNTNSGERDGSGEHDSRSGSPHSSRRSGVHAALARGKKDRRQSRVEKKIREGEEEEGEEGEEEGEEVAQRKEALKILCNVVYNSIWAQERFSSLRILSGVLDRVAKGTNMPAPPSGQFYELRLLFLLTALRPELRAQLHRRAGVSVLTTALEHCLCVQWKTQYEVLLDPTAPPVPQEAYQRAVEILKVLFNITYCTHRLEPDQEDAALYRHLVAVLRFCLMQPCEEQEDTNNLQGHTVNLLSALPLPCLDVLLAVPLEPHSLQSQGVNMDCVHALMLVMERRLDSGEKVKEKLTPILNLLTESCRAHRETRLYLRTHILPPLRDASLRPEEGSTVKSKLIRLMTHMDTDLKHCAADLIFVLCKENVSRFVKYTGYGNAAGLLATRGLLGGQRSKCTGGQYSSDSDSDTEEYRQVKGRVNPVTGRVEEELPDPMEGMTEEEKEEEAQRLVMLFNKLTRDNIFQPMGVDAEGKLVPMACPGDSLSEERESGAESDDLDNVEE
ncbi:synembryn-A [Hypomesus transpacificus]|uniref:synembryn-A n=1 Tax=Hypomesus transpacificus TaxID=137520 RepID=UPI001F0772C0|nr:synembryn-A [Hypomesus transpacificus]